MKFLEDLRREGRGGDMEALVELIPYARFIGLSARQMGDDLVTVLPPSPNIVGNPNLPAVHGGVVGAMLETTSLLRLLLESDSQRLPRTIDVSFNYLRPVSANLTTYGRAHIERQGRRVANVHCQLWQTNVERPVATSHGNFILSPASPPSPNNDNEAPTSR